MVTYGGMSRQGVVVPTSNMIFKDLTLRGFWLTRWNETHTRAERQEVLKTVAVRVSTFAVVYGLWTCVFVYVFIYVCIRYVCNVCVMCER
jgi:hypothetical protein